MELHLQLVVRLKIMESAKEVTGPGSVDQLERTMPEPSVPSASERRANRHISRGILLFGDIG
jgi:hypothetical protein